MKRGDFMSKTKKSGIAEKRTFDYGTHPGAYTSSGDINNELLDTVNSADDVFTKNIRTRDKRANSASPAAADPPVPNRAHTEM